MSIDYKKEFGTRTVEVLEKGYRPLTTLGREVTFLMNCLLGTIVVISQKEDDRKKAARAVEEAKIEENKTKAAKVVEEVGVRNSFLDGEINEDFFNKLDIPVKQVLNVDDRLDFISNIRHGIAHQHIKEKNGMNDKNENTWKGVIIKNPDQNFEIEFTTDELRKFAINLAKKYYEEETRRNS
ncbi:MAG: hypothetical protein LBG17_07375 [Bacteroidales bacterium]|jgi:hypothetical protein|nr:hypothetical protein [Bacteroidales bacterium]